MWNRFVHNVISIFSQRKVAKRKQPRKALLLQEKPLGMTWTTMIAIITNTMISCNITSIMEHQGTSGTSVFRKNKITDFVNIMGCS